MSKKVREINDIQNTSHLVTAVSACYDKPESFNDKGGDRRRSSHPRLPGQRHAVLGDISDLRFRGWAWKLILIMAFRYNYSSWFWIDGEKETGGKKKTFLLIITLAYMSKSMLFFSLYKKFLA